MPAGLLQAMVEAARAATGADSARLLLLSPDGRSTVVAAVSGRADLSQGSRRPLEDGLGGWVVRNRRPILVTSLRRRLCYPQTALGVALTLRGSDSVVAVPISDPVSGSCLGVLGALSPQPMAFHAKSVRVLDLFAQVAGSALTATAREQALLDSWADRRIQEERADLLASLVEKVQEGVALVDRQGIVRYSNPAFGQLFGLSSKELFGRSADSLLRPGEPVDHDQGVEAQWDQDQFELIMPDRPAQRVIALSRNTFEFGRTRAPGWIVTARDATDRARWEASLRHRGEHDDLTGLPNRHRLQRRLSEVTAASRVGPEVGVFFIDIDGTKTVNDALGHEAGDDLLRAVAGRLLARIRPGDLLARYGGDEMVALIEPLSAEEAPAFAERLLGAFSDPIHLQGQTVRVTASLGFTACREGSDPASLLREADSAMYAAKRAGGNGWRAFQADLHDAALADLRLSAELRSALQSPEESGLYLAYQPIVHLGHGYCTAVEALLRWRHPRLGMVSPPQILEVARRLHEL
ncbi:MAG: diguanylate cyclase domain-containing protein, partial [Candidatus Dormibacteria bacterium]